jgi:hypothetical protein
MIGRMTQSVAVFGGMLQPVAMPVLGSAGPTSVSLQSVEPWSNTQLWPPPVSGPAGSLNSFTELSGMKTEPAVPVKMLCDQLAAVFTCASRPTTQPSAGRVVPSEQIAMAFCAPRDKAAVVASSARRRRRRRYCTWSWIPCSLRWCESDQRHNEQNYITAIYTQVETVHLRVEYSHKETFL